MVFVPIPRGAPLYYCRRFVHPHAKPALIVYHRVKHINIFCAFYTIMSSSSVPLQNLFASLFTIPQSGTTAQQQMEDIFRNITNRQQAPDMGPSSSIEQNTNSSNSALISAFRDYNHNIGEFIFYNYNTQQLRDYNTNVKNFVELIRMQSRYSQPIRRSYAASATANARPVHTQTSYSRRLTDRQIRDAVRNVFYDETVHTEPRCPITLADFENGESISQIISCGHIFKREPLAQHFHRGERFCPMCRIDVTSTSDSGGNREQSDSTTEEPRQQRNNNTSNTSSTANTTNEESFMTTMPLSELSQFLSSNPTLQDFSRLFQNSQTTTAASSTDPSNLIFQFEIPISSPEID